MKRLIVLIILIYLTLSVWGQPPIYSQIGLVMSGRLASIDFLQEVDSEGQNQLFLFNTSDSSLYVFDDAEWGMRGFGVGGNPIWDPEGQRLFYNIIPEFGGNITPEIRVLDTDSRQSNLIFNQEGALLFDWNNGQMLYRVISSTNPRQYSLYMFESISGVSTLLATFTEGNSITNLPLPNFENEVNDSLEIDRLIQASWNPTYADWVIIKLGVHSNNAVPSLETNTSYILIYLYNVSTGEYISINEMVGYNTSIVADWNIFGDYLFVVTRDTQAQVHIIKFDPVVTQNHLQIVESSPISRTIIHWLGVSDLFLSVDYPDNSLEDIVFYISRFDDGITEELEVFRLPRSIFTDTGGFGPKDWVYLGDEEEAAELSCIFDETLPTRLEIGGQAQVAFTDGTPSRLRSEPSTWGDVVQSLSEGTAFEVIGGYMCGSGYRWWQVQLGDGTQGWIAEASETEYWIERRAS